MGGVSLTVASILHCFQGSSYLFFLLHHAPPGDPSSQRGRLAAGGLVLEWLSPHYEKP